MTANQQPLISHLLELRRRLLRLRRCASRRRFSESSSEAKSSIKNRHSRPLCRCNHIPCARRIAQTSNLS